MRIRLDIAYDGTGYSGWAVQPGQNTVCGVLQDTLSTIFRIPIRLTVAGRTDAGVHAQGQVAHFDIPSEALDTRSLAGSPARLVPRLARMLPPDVRVIHAVEVPEEFDARFSALRRHYEYRVTTQKWGPAPHRARDTAAYPRDVDLDTMQAASLSLLGLNNFAAFSRYREGSTTIRDLQEFGWKVSEESGGPVYIATVTADAFCWSMVRGLVGAALTVGAGRRSIDWMPALLSETRRSSDFTVAPACGLTLVQVDYPASEELKARNLTTRNLRSVESEIS